MSETSFIDSGIREIFPSDRRVLLWLPWLVQTLPRNYSATVHIQKSEQVCLEIPEATVRVPRRNVFSPHTQKGISVNLSGSKLVQRRPKTTGARVFNDLCRIWHNRTNRNKTILVLMASFFPISLRSSKYMVLANLIKPPTFFVNVHHVKINPGTLQERTKKQWQQTILCQRRNEKTTWSGMERSSWNNQIKQAPIGKVRLNC